MPSVRQSEPNGISQTIHQSASSLFCENNYMNNYLWHIYEGRENKNSLPHNTDAVSASWSKVSSCLRTAGPRGRSTWSQWEYFVFSWLGVSMLADSPSEWSKCTGKLPAYWSGRRWKKFLIKSDAQPNDFFYSHCANKEANVCVDTHKVRFLTPLTEIKR